MNRKTFRLVPLDCPSPAQPVFALDRPTRRPLPPPIRRPQPPPQRGRYPQFGLGPLDRPSQPVFASDTPTLRPQPPAQRHPESIGTTKKLNRQYRMPMSEKSPMCSRSQCVKLHPLPGSSRLTAKPVQESFAQQRKRKEEFKAAEWLEEVEELNKLSMNSCNWRKPKPPIRFPERGQWNVFPKIY
ncbi:pollen-specific leucine-rich repeat extensin-like protein 4 [Pimephales promelas]|uniref:pollen-specific leucine-rich repeat extensin-like protein 4 n=1 Tax=Pimephales promelas TaxID=90988 RepID=UPI001955E864|nr:pollen-specific leucine-rich repeat extensin-like protein 4 [Pimephales promelas]